MDVSLNTPVAQLVTDRPARARIFERLGIDYCCGGDHSLAEACRKHDFDPKTVAEMLDVAADASGPSDTTDWAEASLGALIDHIESAHHAYLRRELPRLERLLTRVTKAHGDRRAWLRPTLDTFLALKDDLKDHMVSEEEQVFPSIGALEENGTAALDRPGMEQMIEEHDETGAALDELRDLTSDYTPPEDACPKFRAAMDGLDELEANMHQHIHKENNILFPRARSLAE